MALKRIRKLPEDQQADKLAPLLERVKSSQAIAGLRETMPALNYPENLPVSERRAEILELIKSNQVVVIAGETGSGKTTQLPKLCMEAGLGVYGRTGLRNSLYG